jgi:hypothetical protein
LVFFKKKKELVQKSEGRREPELKSIGSQKVDHQPQRLPKLIKRKEKKKEVKINKVTQKIVN